MSAKALAKVECGDPIDIPIAFWPNPLHDKTMKEEDSLKKSDGPPGWHTSMLGRLRRYLLTGIVVTAPVAITIYLTYVFFSFIDKHVGKLVPDLWYYGPYGYTTIPGLGIFIAVTFFIVVGWFATNFLGKMIIGVYEYVLDRVPVIRTIYGGIKQVFETIMASQSTAFREAVMLEYPRKGVYSIGFVTGVTQGEVQEVTKAETINVFVPTTPNPTSGYLLFVPRQELIFLQMSVEEAVKLVISGGIITPPTPEEKEKMAQKLTQKQPPKKPKLKKT